MERENLGLGKAIRVGQSQNISIRVNGIVKIISLFLNPRRRTMIPEKRFAKMDEKIIPTHGDNGGPLCSVTAKYEDGTEIAFGHEVLKRYIRADKVKKMCQDFVDLAEKEFEATLAERIADVMGKWFEKKESPNYVIIRDTDQVSECWDTASTGVSHHSIKSFFTHIIEAGEMKGETE